jgi:hypothetical protein
MIEIEHLKDPEDVGRWVVYNREGWTKKEMGRIRSWNEGWIFVVYNCDGNWDDFMKYSPYATHPRDLDFVVEDGR